MKSVYTVIKVWWDFWNTYGKMAAP